MYVGLVNISFTDTVMLMLYLPVTSYTNINSISIIKNVVSVTNISHIPLLR